MASKETKDAKKVEHLEVMRHSASHVMAEAVSSLFPDVKFGIGPATADGFYYDFDLPRTLTPDDLSTIEASMQKIIASNLPFVREEVEKKAALKMFSAQPYKLELIDELPDEKVTIYHQGSFTDLCRGPHVASTREIKAVKLLMILSIHTDFHLLHHSINSLTKSTSTSSRTIRMRMNPTTTTNHNIITQIITNLINMTSSNPTTRHRHRRLNMQQRKHHTLRNHQKLINNNRSLAVWGWVEGYVGAADAW